MYPLWFICGRVQFSALIGCNHLQWLQQTRLFPKTYGSGIASGVCIFMEYPLQISSLLWWEPVKLWVKTAICWGSWWMSLSHPAWLQLLWPPSYFPQLWYDLLCFTWLPLVDCETHLLKLTSFLSVFLWLNCVLMCVWLCDLTSWRALWYSLLDLLNLNLYNVVYPFGVLTYPC